MQEVSRYIVFNIREYLNGQNDGLGGDDLLQVLSEFSCEKNRMWKNLQRNSQSSLQKTAVRHLSCVFSSLTADYRKRWGVNRRN